MRSNDFGKAFVVFGVTLAIGSFFGVLDEPAFGRFSSVTGRGVVRPVRLQIQCAPSDSTLKYRELREREAGPGAIEKKKDSAAGPETNSGPREFWLGDGPRILLHREICIEKEFYQ